MHLHDISNEQFRKLLQDFLSFLKEKDYKEDVLSNYRRTLAQIDSFMSDNGIRKYQPEIGNRYCIQYLAAHTLGKPRTSSIKIMVRHLNDYYDGYDYSLAMAKPVQSLLVSFELVISDYAKHCHENGNKENTIISKVILMKID